MFVVAVRFLSSWAAAVDIISAALKKKKPSRGAREGKLLKGPSPAAHFYYLNIKN